MKTSDTAWTSSKMEQLGSVLEDVLGFLSEHSGEPAVIAAIVGGLFALAAAVILRGGSGRRLDAKKSKLRTKLKQCCPHIEVTNRDGTVLVSSLCNSVGSNPWVTCGLCGRRFTQDEERLMVEQWLTRSWEEPIRVQTQAFQKSLALSEQLDELDGK